MGRLRDIDFTFSIDWKHEQPLALERKLQFYRIIQEACSNLLKHSRATDASCEIFADHDQVLVRLSDNGVGISTHQQTSPLEHHGTFNMRSRAQSLNGEIEIRPGPMKGTEIEIRIPIPKPDDPREGPSP